MWYIIIASYCHHKVLLSSYFILLISVVHSCYYSGKISQTKKREISALLCFQATEFFAPNYRRHIEPLKSPNSGVYRKTIQDMILNLRHVAKSTCGLYRYTLKSILWENFTFLSILKTNRKQNQRLWLIKEHPESLKMFWFHLSPHPSLLIRNTGL